MYGPSSYQPQYQPPQPHPPAPKKRHWLRWTIAGAVVLAAAGGVASGGKKHAATVATHSTAAAAVNTPAAPSSNVPPAIPDPAIPDPAGTVTGTCAYDLATDLSNYDTHAADLNAEVDVENTGNIGIVLTVTVTYPQLAHPGIVLSKKVRVVYGQTLTVSFTRPIGQSQITLLQDWQSGHDYDDGCTYKGTINDTYGTAH